MCDFSAVQKHGQKEPFANRYSPFVSHQLLPFNQSPIAIR